MLLSLNWLKELVDLDEIDTDEIVRRLGLSTAEIESITKKGDDIDDVVIAKVVTAEKLENTNHLNLLSVDDGSGELLQIVTGAPNVYAGMITALVRVGGMVSGNRIKKAKLAGIESFGMCCSEKELGIGNDSDGIIDFKSEYPIGTSIKELFPIEDIIIEIDNKSLTNRPDLWGHLGFARELSVIFDRKLKKIELVDLSKLNGLKKLDIQVKSNDCFRYSGLTIDNVTVKKSPIDIKIKLNYCGFRDINLLADLTNLIMLELGQPMHAFDNSLVKGIIVRNSQFGEQITTLEEEDHKVPENSLLICDTNNNPIAIAGIKGGLSSGITPTTKSFLLESAVFDSTSIRKTSRSIGLVTDSSLRYEKSLDPKMTVTAIARLIALLKNIEKGILISSDLTDVENKTYPKIEITLNADFIRNRIGKKIENDTIFNILSKLGFELKNIKGNTFTIVVPSYRATKDISIKEDIVEEIARIVGYDNIEAMPIISKSMPVDQTKEHWLEYKTKRLLAEKYNCNEIHSYIWNYKDFNKSIGLESPSFVQLVDSSNSGQSGVRSEMIPSMLQVYKNNKNYFDTIKIDEVGRVVVGKDEFNNVIEEKHLCILIAENKKEEEIYFELKKMLENICLSLTNTKVAYLSGSDKSYLFKNASCKLVVDGNEIGNMGIIHPIIKKNLETKNNIGVLEIDFSKLVNAEETENEIKKVSKFQSVVIDFNFMVPKSMKYNEIETILNDFRCKFKINYKMIDIYKGDNKSDLISMTFRFEIYSLDHTLTQNEIDNFRRRLLETLKVKGIELKA